jgi:hypothetical protein
MPSTVPSSVTTTEPTLPSRIFVATSAIDSSAVAVTTGLLISAPTLLA